MVFLLSLPRPDFRYRIWITVFPGSGLCFSLSYGVAYACWALALASASASHEVTSMPNLLLNFVES